MVKDPGMDRCDKFFFGYVGFIVVATFAYLPARVMGLI
jgi:hypothetical protein